MSITEGQRVTVEGATGDRERFNGRHGRVVEVRPCRRRRAERYAFVRLDGGSNVRGRGYRVFYPHELVASVPAKEDANGH